MGRQSERCLKQVFSEYFYLLKNYRIHDHWLDKSSLKFYLEREPRQSHFTTNRFRWTNICNYRVASLINIICISLEVKEKKIVFFFTQILK